MIYEGRLGGWQTLHLQPKRRKGFRPQQQQHSRKNVGVLALGDANFIALLVAAKLHSKRLIEWYLSPECALQAMEALNNQLLEVRMKERGIMHLNSERVRNKKKKAHKCPCLPLNNLAL